MDDLLLDIIEYLVEEGVLEGDGVDAFRDFAPDSPDDVTIIYEYQGDPQALHEDTAVHRSLQIVSRSKQPTTAKVKANEIHAFLSPPGRYKKLNENRWCQLYPRQTPFKIKTDDNGRVYYGYNFGVTSYKDY